MYIEFFFFNLGSNFTISKNRSVTRGLQSSSFNLKLIDVLSLIMFPRNEAGKNCLAYYIANNKF